MAITFISSPSVSVANLNTSLIYQTFLFIQK
jgi:hypothetical protein